MKRYVEFTEDGNLARFYSDDIHDNIPGTAVPITDDQWQTYCSAPSLYKKAENGDEPCWLKTKEELDAEEADRPPTPKTPDQIRVEELEAQIAEMNLSQIEFMTTILQTLGVE